MEGSGGRRASMAAGPVLAAGGGGGGGGGNQRNLLGVEALDDTRKISDLSKMEFGEGIGGRLAFIRVASKWMHRVGLRPRGKRTLIMDLGEQRAQVADKAETAEQLLEYLSRRRCGEMAHLRPRCWEQLLAEVRAHNTHLINIRALSQSVDAEGVLLHYANQEQVNTALLQMALEQAAEMKAVEAQIRHLELSRSDEKTRQEQRISDLRDQTEATVAEASRTESHCGQKLQLLLAMSQHLTHVFRRTEDCMEAARVDSAADLKLRLANDKNVYKSNASECLGALEQQLDSLMVVQAYFDWRNRSRNPSEPTGGAMGNRVEDQAPTWALDAEIRPKTDKTYTPIIPDSNFFNADTLDGEKSSLQSEQELRASVRKRFTKYSSLWRKESSLTDMIDEERRRGHRRSSSGRRRSSVTTADGVLRKKQSKSGNSVKSSGGMHPIMEGSAAAGAVQAEDSASRQPADAAEEQPASELGEGVVSGDGNLRSDSQTFTFSTIRTYTPSAAAAAGGRGTRSVEPLHETGGESDHSSEQQAAAAEEPAAAQPEGHSHHATGAAEEEAQEEEDETKKTIESSKTTESW